MFQLVRGLSEDDVVDSGQGFVYVYADPGKSVFLPCGGKIVWSCIVDGESIFRVYLDEPVLVGGVSYRVMEIRDMVSLSYELFVEGVYVSVIGGHSVGRVGVSGRIRVFLAVQ